MQSDTRLEGDFTEFPHWVDEPVVDGGSAGVDEDRSFIDGLADGVHVRAVVGPAIHVLHVEVEDLGGLVHRRVTAVGGDDIEPAEIRARLPLHFPRHLDGLEDALGAPRR